jgi:apolipoprotein N-acyltransferase
VQPFLDEMGRQVAAQGGVLMLGALTSEGNDEVYNNSLLAMTDPPALYTKRHLVPFGEYFPVPSFVRGWMRLMSLPYIDAVPGPGGQPPIAVAGERVAVTICYEDVFGAEQLHYFPDATLLVNVSNDAWFGESIAADQHLQIARLRAAEVGRYQLRATNTGITAVIDPGGQVVASLPQFEPGVLEATVQGFTGLTPYARLGNWPVVIGALLVLLAQLAMTKLTMRPGT